MKYKSSIIYQLLHYRSLEGQINVLGAVLIWTVSFYIQKFRPTIDEEEQDGRRYDFT